MRLIFGGIIAAILLGLYIYAVYTAVMLANGGGGDLNSGFVLVLQTVGGLISALVIAELAVTKPGEPPVARAIAPAADGSGADPTQRRTVTIIAWGYVAVWILLGLTAFVVGTLNHPGAVQSLTDLGQAWLGLAVAAAYAYFGIDPGSGG